MNNPIYYSYETCGVAGTFTSGTIKTLSITAANTAMVMFVDSNAGLNVGDIIMISDGGNTPTNHERNVISSLRETTTTLAAAVTASATVLTVASKAGFEVNDVILINAETATISSIATATNDITVSAALTAAAASGVVVKLSRVNLMYALVNTYQANAQVSVTGYDASSVAGCGNIDQQTTCNANSACRWEEDLGGRETIVPVSAVQTGRRRESFSGTDRRRARRRVGNVDYPGGKIGWPIVGLQYSNYDRFNGYFPTGRCQDKQTTCLPTAAPTVAPTPTPTVAPTTLTPTAAPTFPPPAMDYCEPKKEPQCPCIDSNQIPTSACDTSLTWATSGALCVTAANPSYAAATGNVGTDVQYPESYGEGCKVHPEPGFENCFNLQTGVEKSLSSQENWCTSPWCYIDPCNCDANDATATGYFPEQDLTYSYVTCNSIDISKYKESPDETDSKWNAVTDRPAQCTRAFAQCACVTSIDVPKASCPTGLNWISPQKEVAKGEFSWMRQCLIATIGSTAFGYPTNYGIGCGVHAEPGSSECWDSVNGVALPKTEAASWCYNEWCYVDPCTCNANDVAASTYFPGYSLAYSNKACAQPWYGSSADFDATTDRPLCTLPPTAPPTAMPGMTPAAFTCPGGFTSVTDPIATQCSSSVCSNLDCCVATPTAPPTLPPTTAAPTMPPTTAAPTAAPTDRKSVV